MSEIHNTIFQGSAGNIALFLILVICILLLSCIALRIPHSLFSRDSDGNSEPKNVSLTDSELSSQKVLAASMQPVALLFIDLRDFHKLASDKSPEDIVSILNRFFDLIGSAAIGYGGWIDNYLGDGILIVYKNDINPEQAVKKAIKSIGAIRAALSKLNKELNKKVKQPLQIGIGLHSGPALIANLGHKKSSSKRIVGPAVKITYKLEELCKEKKVQIIMTAEAARSAGVVLDGYTTEYVVLRDHNIPIEVLCFSARQKMPRV